MMNLKKINDIKQELIAKLSPIKTEQALEELFEDEEDDVNKLLSLANPAEQDLHRLC